MCWYFLILCLKHTESLRCLLCVWVHICRCVCEVRWLESSSNLKSTCGLTVYLVRGSTLASTRILLLSVAVKNHLRSREVNLWKFFMNSSSTPCWSMAVKGPQVRTWTHCVQSNIKIVSFKTWKGITQSVGYLVCWNSPHSTRAKIAASIATFLTVRDVLKLQRQWNYSKWYVNSVLHLVNRPIYGHQYVKGSWRWKGISSTYYP